MIHLGQVLTNEVKTLVFIGGNIGAGKSTLARELYLLDQKSHVVVKKSEFTTDKVEFDLFQFKLWADTSDYTLIVIDTHFAYAPKESVLLREHNIWEPTFIEQDWRSEFDQDMMRELAQDFCVLCAFIEVDPTELIQRLRLRAKNMRDHLVNFQYLEYRSHKERELFMQVTKAMRNDLPENIIRGSFQTVECCLLDMISKGSAFDDVIRTGY